MTTLIALNIDRSLPLLSNATSNPSNTEDKSLNASNSAVVLVKDSTSTAVDSVSISIQLQQALSDVNKKAVKKEEGSILNNSGTSDRTAAKVEFVYDQNGDVITKFMDTANRLVYQTPSELMLHLKETTAQSSSSVNTKV